MFKIDLSENYRISMNRGDSGTIHLKAASAFFATGDKVKFLVVTAGNYTEIKLTKQYTVESGASATEFDITLDPDDTKEMCEPFATGYLTYWYEISVENAAGTVVSTVLGADENGSKELWIYPEGAAIV